MRSDGVVDNKKTHLISCDVSENSMCSNVVIFEISNLGKFHKCGYQWDMLIKSYAHEKTWEELFPEWNKKLTNAPHTMQATKD